MDKKFLSSRITLIVIALFVLVGMYFVVLNKDKFLSKPRYIEIPQDMLVGKTSKIKGGEEATTTPDVKIYSISFTTDKTMKELKDYYLSYFTNNGNWITEVNSDLLDTYTDNSKTHTLSFWKPGRNITVYMEFDKPTKLTHVKISSNNYSNVKLLK